MLLTTQSVSLIMVTPRWGNGLSPAVGWGTVRRKVGLRVRGRVSSTVALPWGYTPFFIQHTMASPSSRVRVRVRVSPAPSLTVLPPGT